jgi:hypothetical protein
MSQRNRRALFRQLVLSMAALSTLSAEEAVERARKMTAAVTDEELET